MAERAGTCLDLTCCVLCPRKCGVNREQGEKGFCRAGSRTEVYAAHLHHGEEPPLSGTRGSGTVFFAHCTMHCLYCQNYHLSQLHCGKEMSEEKLGELFLELASRGAHNINLVTPTHYVPQIKNAVGFARTHGLSVPIVYNTGGYERVATLKELEGVIDVYLADMRYSEESFAYRYSGAADYVSANRRAIKEMHRQAGDLRVDAEGIAVQGLLVRHLILPGNISGTQKVFEFLSRKISRDTYVSLMSQYFPAYRAKDVPELSRAITRHEYREAVRSLYECGLRHGWVQEFMGGKVDSGFAGTTLSPDV